MFTVFWVLIFRFFFSLSFYSFLGQFFYFTSWTPDLSTITVWAIIFLFFFFSLISCIAWLCYILSHFLKRFFSVKLTQGCTPLRLPDRPQITDSWIPAAAGGQYAFQRTTNPRHSRGSPVECVSISSSWKRLLTCNSNPKRRATASHQTKESEDFLTSAVTECCQHFRFHQQTELFWLCFLIQL